MRRTKRADRPDWYYRASAKERERFNLQIELGEVLKDKRLALKLTQRQVADLLDLKSTRQVVLLERGDLQLETVVKHLWALKDKRKRLDMGSRRWTRVEKALGAEAFSGLIG